MMKEQFKNKEKVIQEMTLGFIVEDGRILLGMKKRGLGEGKWNGFGGKVEPEETIEQAMIREFEEECGLVVSGLEKRAQLHFEIDDYDKHILGHVYRITEYAGDAYETDEMRPQWFSLESLPYEQMWQDDPLWLPLFLQGEMLQAYFYFKDQQSMLDYDIQRVEKI
jgi:8-oxo-dGTP pyrophosphatase MutT (NUDIX family)